MRQTKKTPTPPTAAERDGLARTYSYTLDGTVLSLTSAALKQITIHRRDASSASRRERRRMASILRDDKLQARINKAIQRQLDKVERRAPPKKVRVRVELQHRRRYRRKQRKIASRSVVPLPAYKGPILDRQGRRGLVMTVEYDGAKKHSFGIFGRRVIYISDPEHCELDAFGRPIFTSNMGADLDEILMGADLVELAQRESRADAKSNVNLIIQLPHDVSQEVRVAIMKAVACELFGRHGLPYAAALHRPDPDGDQRNYHAHICGGWRPMTRVAPYQWDIAEDYRSDLDGAEYWRHARRRVAEIMTSTLERSGTERHYTHLSNAERGLVHKPQKKLDKRKTRTAREGEFVADVEANRRTMAANIALENAIETKRKQRRERARRRALAAFARVEIAVKQPVDLRPVAPAARSLDAASIGSVDAYSPGAKRSVTTVQRPRDRSPTIAKVATAEASPFAVIVSQRIVAPLPGNAQHVRPIRPDSAGAISVSAKNIRTVSSSPFTRAAAAIHSVGPLPSPGSVSIHPITPKAVPQTLAAAPELRPVSTGSAPAVDLRRVESRQPIAASLRPVAPASSLSVTLRPVAVASPEMTIPRLAKVSLNWPPSPNPPTLRGDTTTPVRTPVIKQVAALTEREWPALRSVAAGPMAPRTVAAEKVVSTPLAMVGGQSDARVLLRRVAAARSLERGPVCSRVELSRPGDDPVICGVSPAPGMPAIRPVPVQSKDRNAGSAITLRPVAPVVPKIFDSTSVETIRAFAERLATMMALRSDRDAKAHPGTPDHSAATLPPDATEPTLACAADVAAFADAMRRRPSGLCLWDDNSVHPMVAIASSWGLSKADFASRIAKRELMPLYVEQELRFKRLETELKFIGASKEELANPQRKLADRLSREAAETLKIYRRSELLHLALGRVDRELRQGKTAASRTGQMSERGIDWRAIDQATKQRRRALAAAAQQIGEQHKGIG
ncbi:MobA/MobL family protein [Erythrobacter sp. MTPC3]|uniref:MobA/MobL family protein n=1 Tax=Erythrobacter sp. MTPC3 TaxID=3056564 RepID=UPI0036F302D1